MGYLRCESCGAKALSAASQCPKCTVPFELTDARGYRVQLKSCRSCGIMHRSDRSCHWCIEVAQPSWRSARVLSTVASVTIMAAASVGVYNFRASIRETASVIGARAFSPMGAGAPETNPSIATRQLPTAQAVAPKVGSPSANVVSDSLPSPVQQIASVPDSIEWTPAVARTWVNVRSDANRGGDVVGVINPSARAMLGTTRAGWRQVKSPDVTGWVDPKLFEPDPARSRGL